VRIVRFTWLTTIMAFGAFSLLSCKRQEASPARTQTTPVELEQSVDAGAIETELPAFALPTGSLPRIDCMQAHAIVTQVRGHLPYAVAPEAAKSAPERYAESTALWIDSLGLLTGDGKSRFAMVLKQESAAVWRELEDSRSSCSHSRVIAKALQAFVNDLRNLKLDAARTSKPSQQSNAHDATAEALPTRGASEARVRSMIARRGDLSPVFEPFAKITFDRALPELSEDEWQGVVLAGALRAWLPMTDGHSEWAPAGEETSIYDVDLDDLSRGRLFSKAEPTLVGARIEHGPAAPLQVGDVILSVNGVALGGLSPEQLLQASAAAFEQPEPCTVQIARNNQISELRIEPSASVLPEPSVNVQWLQGAGASTAEVGVITIQDIHDRLGTDVSDLIVEAHKRTNVIGLVLDLRGNGGGSMDGAIDALGRFLPGLPMFPLKSRLEAVLPDVAPVPPLNEQWDGPVAALVDGDTASAAEMLAGALRAYNRGAVVGSRTFGKGCVQEYIDDDAHTGVLRLTTLLYALPDGSAIQRTGLPPTLAFNFGPLSPESEASSKNVPPKWTGPDVRPKPMAAYKSWPKIEGSLSLSPCKSPLLCEAIEALSKPKRASRK
jgi:carboxyl-terminal processing protease